MNKLDLAVVTAYVEQHIGEFHDRRLQKLKSLKMEAIIRRKNPYLFRAKNMLVASDLIRAILDAYLSSSEEGIFGNWLEGLAIHVCEHVYGGRKSSSSGIDLEFDSQGTRYLVSIKSGPDWGNDSQVKKMIDHFNSARKVLRTSGGVRNVIAVNGCCYGRSSAESEYRPNGDYFKYCGQSFWHFISNDPDLYKALIIPLGHHALERNRQFEESYAEVLNRFTLDFIAQFCDNSGAIDWNKLLDFNSKRV